MPEQSSIDLSELKSRTLGNAALLTELLSLFKTHAPTTLDLAAAAIAQGDLPTAGRALHKLKGSAATISAGALARGVAGAEAFIRAQDAASLDAALPSLRREMESCLRQINELNAGLK